ncbi:hypothetical protein [Aquimarina celericrescens]|uniref:Sensor of ECF-type sigma factor n=1 Tax=Aquimarina celericrescens TaxID=1964542 RepID=A0ABW5ASS1_9FLAO|nr:hypothetical protein [Aquimarina celericrescens]
MNKILLCIGIAFVSLNAIGQNPAGEKIKAFKVAYITEQLNLSSKEAQQFWPIYNTHEETLEKLKKEERKLIRALKDANEGSDGLSDRQAGEFLSNYLEAETQKTQARKTLIKDLQTVISNKKILRLIKAENDFNKRLLERIRQWRNRRND